MVLVVQDKTAQIHMPAYPDQQVTDSTYAKSEVGPAAPAAPVQVPVEKTSHVVSQDVYQQPMVAVEQAVAPAAVTYAPMVPPVPDIQVSQATQYQQAVAGNGYGL